MSRNPQNKATGSYTIPLPKDALTGNFTNGGRDRGSIIIVEPMTREELKHPTDSLDDPVTLLGVITELRRLGYSVEFKGEALTQAKTRLEG